MGDIVPTVMIRSLRRQGAAALQCVYLLVLVALVLLPVSSQAAEDQPTESKTPSQQGDAVTAAFSKHDPHSTIELDHSMWSDFLSKTVVFAGNSARRISRGRKRGWVGSNMRFGNDLPSRYENNRVILSGFEDEYFALLRQYREALESVPDQLPLSNLNRAEQLAYWLNLYNVHALEHVAAHYPAETMQALRSAPGEEPDGVWHERTLEVAGVPLSLVDIERKILFPIWDDPLVLYGLWQGAIGGPRLPLKAYTGSGVWQALRENAREFVNSNRGMKPNGEVLEVSLLYGWGAPLFDGDEDLRRHIASLARPPFSDGLEAVQRAETRLYDWHLADLSGGTHHQGQWNNMAAYVAGASGGGRSGEQFINGMLRSDDTHRSMPPQTIELLTKMERFNVRTRRTRVTIRECPPGSDCALISDDDDREAAEAESDDQPDPDR